jgi:hypothetical protein
MMTPQQFALALRQTESDSNPRAYGDDGLALTSYQVHPAWVWDQIRRAPVTPRVDDSWEAWIEQIVCKFYRIRMQTSSEVQIAMEFHIGHFVAPTDTAWDVPYAARFAKFAAIAMGQSDAT